VVGLAVLRAGSSGKNLAVLGVRQRIVQRLFSRAASRTVHSPIDREDRLRIRKYAIRSRHIDGNGFKRRIATEIRSDGIFGITGSLAGTGA